MDCPRYTTLGAFHLLVHKIVKWLYTLNASVYKYIKQTVAFLWCSYVHSYVESVNEDSQLFTTFSKVYNVYIDGSVGGAIAFLNLFHNGNKDSSPCFFTISPWWIAPFHHDVLRHDSARFDNLSCENISQQETNWAKTCPRA